MRLYTQTLKQVGNLSRIRVIVVEPKNPGNLGAIARLMKNFGFDDLVVVNINRIPSEDEFRSMKGREILSKVKMVKTLEEAIRGLSIVAGTSGVKSESARGVLRNYITPHEFSREVSGIKGKIGIVLGREDNGLTNRELSLCDFFIHIPSSDDYPILNVSSAASILLYELSRGKTSGKKEAARREDFDMLIEKFKTNLVKNRYPPHRVEKTTLLFRRVLSRAIITPYENRVLMGALDCRNLLRSLEV